MIGLDTTAIIDLFKGVPSVKEKLEQSDVPVCTTIVSYLELMFGLDSTIQKQKEEEKFYDAFFQTTIQFNLTSKSCKKASEINQVLKKSGKVIDEFDCTLAAVFLTNGIDTILTRNTKHFERIPGLKVASY